MIHLSFIKKKRTYQGQSNAVHTIVSDLYWTIIASSTLYGLLWSIASGIVANGNNPSERWKSSLSSENCPKEQSMYIFCFFFYFFSFILSFFFLLSVWFIIMIIIVNNINIKLVIDFHLSIFQSSINMFANVETKLPHFAFSALHLSFHSSLRPLS